VKITCNYRRHPARVGICESAAELAADRVIGERASEPNAPDREESVEYCGVSRPSPFCCIREKH
jgi:hypothetical protein